MAKYRGVTRLITIFISRKEKKCAIDICPDPAEFVVGDKIQWQVQNAPPDTKVSVGNFRRLDPPPEILLRAKKAPLVKARTLKPKGPSGLTHKTRAADVGFYKFDILFNGITVLDPDLEIRDPKRP
jgi:hypothetical protein